LAVHYMLRTPLYPKRRSEKLNEISLVSFDAVLKPVTN